MSPQREKQLARIRSWNVPIGGICGIFCLIWMAETVDCLRGLLERIATWCPSVDGNERVAPMRRRSLWLDGNGLSGDVMNVGGSGLASGGRVQQSGIATQSDGCCCGIEDGLLRMMNGCPDRDIGQWRRRTSFPIDDWSKLPAGVRVFIYNISWFRSRPFYSFVLLLFHLGPFGTNWTGWRPHGARLKSAADVSFLFPSFFLLFFFLPFWSL